MAGANGRSKRSQRQAGPIVDKRALLERVSHDLRNELGGIVFMAGHLAGSVTDDDVGRRVGKSATSIKRMAIRMGGLLEQLLDVAGFEVGLLVGGAIDRPPTLGVVRSPATATEARRR
jgi:signal transduction histidine kinase